MTIPATVEIAAIVKGAMTYVNRAGHSYKLEVKDDGGPNIEVFYEITAGVTRRIVRRSFPREVELDGRFLWILGLLRGEGLRSVGAKSSMYRFYVVNNDIEVIRAVVKVMDESRLAPYQEIRGRPGLIRISYGPNCDKERAREYWAKGLGLHLSQIVMASHAEPQKRARYGSCMFTLNDVLLRRVFDLIAEGVFTLLFEAQGMICFWNG